MRVDHTYMYCTMSTVLVQYLHVFHVYSYCSFDGLGFCTSEGSCRSQDTFLMVDLL
jgi:hypothetical protein